MDSDQGKLFIGGISWETTEDKLKEHFSNYGDVHHASVMREKNTGKPRGFGFVVFADPSILDRVLEDKHVIDGRTVSESFNSFLVYSNLLHFPNPSRWFLVSCLFCLDFPLPSSKRLYLHFGMYKFIVVVLCSLLYKKWLDLYY